MLRPRFVAVWLPVVCGLTWAALAATAGEEVAVGAFSRADAGGALPEGWGPLDFAGIDEHTRYALVEEDGVVVVRAESQDSASGLTRSIEIDLATHPILEWSWRIAHALDAGDVTRKEGDDYPARVYVAFAFDPERAGLLERMEFEALRMLHGEYPPGAALNYIWASYSPIGTVVPNPYADRVHMIVVESGAARIGQWLRESRNVAADYELAFGEPAPRISGVAIMTDTDDTGESALAWFGDIVFRSSPSRGDAYQARSSSRTKRVSPTSP